MNVADILDITAPPLVEVVEISLLTGQRGPVGAQGPIGPQGPPGDVTSRVAKTGDTMSGPLVVQNLSVGATPNFGADYPGIEVPGRGTFMIGAGGDKNLYVVAYDSVASINLRPGAGASKQLSVQFDRVQASTPIHLPADPTQPLQAATKQYVDARIWTGTQAAYNAIGTKDPTVLYVVSG